MRFVRYLTVQVAAYGLDMGLFLILFMSFVIDPLFANVLSKIMAGGFAFIAHRSFTFDVVVAGEVRGQALRYLALLLLNIPLSALVLSFLLWIIPFPVAAKFVSDVILVFLTYWFSKQLVFSTVDAEASSAVNGIKE